VAARPSNDWDEPEAKQGTLRALAHTSEGLAAMALICFYLALLSGHLYSIDGLLMYRQSLSLAYAHSIHLTPPILWGAKITDSKYGLGLSLLYLPGLILWSWLAPYIPQSGSNPYNWAMFYQDPLYTVAGAPIQILIAVASAYLLARLLRELGFGRATALWGMALYGLASPAIVYAKADWAQPLAGLCWIAALYGAIRFGRTGVRRDLGITALAVGYAVVTRPVEGTLLLPAVLAILAPRRRLMLWPRGVRQAMGVVLGSYLVGLALTLVVNWARYGSPLNFGYAGEGWTAPLQLSLPAVLVSPGWGIIWEFPAILLAPLGVAYLFRREQGRIGVIMGGLIIAQLLNTAAWHDWAGGWNWGLRLFVPALPITTVLAIAGMAGLPDRLRPWLPALLFAAGAIWAAPCVLTNLLGGYAGMVSSAQIYLFSNYAPIGAWQFMHSWRDLDILWVRSSQGSGNTSLILGVLLLVGATVLARRAHRLTRSEAVAGRVVR
jgi:hypothetical protein